MCALHESKLALNSCPGRYSEAAFIDLSPSPSNRPIQAATSPVYNITEVNCIYTKLQKPNLTRKTL